MSFSNSDRNIQAKIGRMFPTQQELDQMCSMSLAKAISYMLKLEFSDNQPMVKSIMACTRSNERTVKNWIAGYNAPNAEALISLMGGSDIVLMSVLHLAGRKNLMQTKVQSDILSVLVQLLRLLQEQQNELTSR